MRGAPRAKWCLPQKLPSKSLSCSRRGCVDAGPVGFGKSRAERRAKGIAVAGPGKSEDGTNPEVHIWRIAPTRRDLLGFLGWGAVLNSIGVGTLAFVRFMYPRVLFEPPSQFKIGAPPSTRPSRPARSGSRRCACG